MDPIRDNPPSIGNESDQIFQRLYYLSQKDYKRYLIRGFLKKSFTLTIIILSILGILSTVFYVVFLRDYLKELQQEITRYNDRVVELRGEIKKLSASEDMYREQVEQYRYMLDNLKIEDSRIVDFNLTNAVRSNIDTIDAVGSGAHEYRNIHRGNTNFREIALTFDLGTGKDLPIVYSILHRFNVKTTIFIGNEMSSESFGSLFNEKNIHYLTKLGQLGCEFGNHTWSHYNLKRSLYETSRRKRLNLSFVSDDVIDELAFKLEFDRVNNRFYKETGISLSSHWRAPYGAVDYRILTLAAKAGYPNHILWSGNRLGPLDFLDYVTRRTITVRDKDSGKYTRVKNPYYFTSKEMLQRMKEWERVDKHGLNGAIAISHLGTARNHDRMVKILPEFISYFQKKEYHFVTVSQVINDIKDY